jgi:hypothetical protein
MPFLKRSAKQPLDVVRLALQSNFVAQSQAAAEALRNLVEDESWRDNGKFADFGEFAIAPDGLNVRDQETAELLRDMLLRFEKVSEWYCVLKRIARTRSSPAISVGDLKPFYTVGRSPNGIDRQILMLADRDPEAWVRILDGTVSRTDAAREAGIIRPRDQCRCQNYQSLPRGEKLALLNRLFDSIAVADQQHFLKTRSGNAAQNGH